MKYNYFDALESLADCAYNATLSACAERRANTKKALLEIRDKRDEILFSLEKTLFADFLPPLERDDIAAYAHALSRVVDAALEHDALRSGEKFIKKRIPEETICLDIAKEIKENTAILKNLKKPSEIPDIQKLRQLLRSGSDMYTAELSRIASGTSISAASSIHSVARLRKELAMCFDCLLETMLNNI